MSKSALINSLKSKEAKIGVIGLGYVGLPLAMCFSEEGFKTIGFDIDEERIQELKQGKDKTLEVKKEDLSGR